MALPVVVTAAVMSAMEKDPPPVPVIATPIEAESMLPSTLGFRGGATGDDSSLFGFLASQQEATTAGTVGRAGGVEKRGSLQAQGSPAKRSHSWETRERLESAESFAVQQKWMLAQEATMLEADATLDKADEKARRPLLPWARTPLWSRSTSLNAEYAATALLVTPHPNTPTPKRGREPPFPSGRRPYASVMSACSPFPALPQYCVWPLGVQDQRREQAQPCRAVQDSHPTGELFGDRSGGIA